MKSGSFKDVNNKRCLEFIYLMYMYKKDLALNNLHWLICQKPKSGYSFGGGFFYPSAEIQLAYSMAPAD